MTQHTLGERDFLAHMLDAVGQIQTYAQGKQAADFLSDRYLQDAVIRNIEVLGEASRNLLDRVPNAATRFPGIPFAAIYGMRNHLSHGYFSINLDAVWIAIEQDIPNLRKELEAALAMLNQSSA